MVLVEQSICAHIVLILPFLHCRALSWLHQCILPTLAFSDLFLSLYYIDGNIYFFDNT